MTDYETPPPSYKLFTSKAIGVGAFLGGPLAVTMLIANNFGRMGDRKNRNRTCILGLGLTVSFMWVLMTTPQSIMQHIPNVVFPALSSLLAYYLTECLQGKILRKHFEQLGAKASGWALAGWSLLSFVSTMVIALLFIPFIPPFDFEEDIYTEGLLGNEIYYSENIDADTLRELGDFLTEAGYFTADYAASIQVIKNQSGYAITLPCARDYRDDAETIATAKELGQVLSVEILHGPVSISLIDEDISGCPSQETHVSKVGICCSLFADWRNKGRQLPLE